MGLVEAFFPCSTTNQNHYQIFVNLLTVFCFSMPMPIDTCACSNNNNKKNPQKLFSFALRHWIKPLCPLLFCIHRNSRTPDMFLHFCPSTKLPRNARGNIIRRKTDTFQNNFRGITMDRVPTLGN